MTTYTGSDGLTYDYKNRKLTISGSGAITSLSFGVLTLSDNTTVSLADMIELTVESGVTSVQQSAFRECYYLVTANLNARTIGDYALVNCSSLETIRFGSNTYQLGTWLTNYDTKIEKIIFEGNAPYGSGEALRSSGASQTVTVYSTGWANDTTFKNAYCLNTELTFVYVIGIPNTYRHLLMDSHKIQVDSAIRDADGNVIDDTYTKPADFKTINGSSIIGSGDLSVGGISAHQFATVGEMVTAYFTSDNKTKWRVICVYPETKSIVALDRVTVVVDDQRLVIEGGYSQNTTYNGNDTIGWVVFTSPTLYYNSNDTSISFTRRSANLLNTAVTDTTQSFNLTNMYFIY